MYGRRGRNRRADLTCAYHELGKQLTSSALPVVGQYTLQRTIGQGTYGKVRLATHRLINARVAVKQIPKQHVASLTREIHHHRRLHHPNVLQLYEVIQTESHIWMVTELCTGGELYDLVARRGALPETEACALFSQLCLAVSYIHELGIVHRDLKLENILLDGKGQVKLSDFGFTREFEAHQALDTRCGTPLYSAPEMLDGRRYMGEAVDVWSMGVILYALVCGTLPFDDDNEAVLYEKILHGEPVIPSSLSLDLQDLLISMLQKEAVHRPSISLILCHPWLHAHPSPSSTDGGSARPATSRPPLMESDEEKQLLHALQALGLAVGQIRHSVLTHACDSAGAFWWLLLHQTQKRSSFPTTGSTLYLSDGTLTKSRSTAAGCAQRKDSDAHHNTTDGCGSRNANPAVSGHTHELQGTVSNASVDAIDEPSACESLALAMSGAHLSRQKSSSSLSLGYPCKASLSSGCASRESSTPASQPVSPPMKELPPLSQHDAQSSSMPSPLPPLVLPLLQRTPSSTSRVSSSQDQPSRPVSRSSRTVGRRLSVNSAGSLPSFSAFPLVHSSSQPSRHAPRRRRDSESNVYRLRRDRSIHRHHGLGGGRFTPHVRSTQSSYSFDPRHPRSLDDRALTCLEAHRASLDVRESSPKLFSPSTGASSVQFMKRSRSPFGFQGPLFSSPLVTPKRKPRTRRLEQQSAKVQTLRSGPSPSPGSQSLSLCPRTFIGADDEEDDWIDDECVFVGGLGQAPRTTTSLDRTCDARPRRGSPCPMPRPRWWASSGPIAACVPPASLASSTPTGPSSFPATYAVPDTDVMGTPLRHKIRRDVQAAVIQEEDDAVTDGHSL